MYCSVRCSALAYERLTLSIFDHVSEVVAAGLRQRRLRSHALEQSFLGLGDAGFVEEAGELFEPFLLLDLRLLKPVNELHLLELELLGLLFEFVDLGLVHVSVLAVKVLHLLPPLANEVLPLL